MPPEKTNNEFYANCLVYFDVLRKLGRNDDSFEDEYFFTLPVISNKTD